MSVGWFKIPRKDFDKNQLDKILTIVGSDGSPVKLYEFDLAKDSALIPRGSWSTIVSRTEFQDHILGDPTNCGRAWEPKPKEISLRPDQIPAVASIENELKIGFGTVLEAGCGKGKTVMALELARRFGVSTCVLVHKSFLMDQWKERIEQFFPELKVGFWRQGQIDSGNDFDVVIAMVQSLTGKREYDQSQYDSFGMIITDEVHRFAAPTWQSVIVNFKGRYRLGLTATPERRDGMQEVFYKHIGRIGYTIKGQTSIPTVHKVALDTMFPQKDYVNRWNGQVNTAKLITLVASHKGRSSTIASYAVRAVLKNRKVLILSDRREQVDFFAKEIDALTSEDIKVSKYVGGMSKENLALSAQSDVIIGTFSMAEEGLDIPDLDTLLLATPKTNITQSVGRILREHPGKQAPVVVDFVDEQIEILRAYWGARQKRYKSLGYIK